MIKARLLKLRLLALLAIDKLAADLLAEVLDDPDFVEGLLFVALYLIAAVDVFYPDLFAGRSDLVEEVLVILLFTPFLLALFGAAGVVLLVFVFGEFINDTEDLFLCEEVPLGLGVHSTPNCSINISI